MNKLLYGVMASMGLLLAATSVRAEEHKMPANDREFVMHMATGGHAEVKFSELADKRAANEKVKEFAAQMVKDHSEANNKLAEHAKNQKIAVVAGFERDKRDKYMELSKLNGADFDKAYMKQAVESHEKSVKTLEHFATKAMDPLLKKWIDETLPTVKHHLKMAKEVNDMVNKP